MRPGVSLEHWTHANAPNKNNLLSDFRSIALIFSLGMVMVWGAHYLAHGRLATILVFALGYSLWEIAITTLLVGLSAWGIFFKANPTEKIVPNHPLAPEPLSLSILIAAYNEDEGIGATVRSVLNQTHLPEEIIIANDGSTDGTDQVLIDQFQLEPIDDSPHYQSDPDHSPRILLLNVPHRGKGWALNAALAAGCDDIVVTLDADTRLETNALAEIMRPFSDKRTAAVGGFIFVRNGAAGYWIAQRQYVEYLKNFLCRIGLAQAQVCLQVSGAFGAYRRQLLVKLGGFSTKSVVEDYEIIYRLHKELREQRQDYRIIIAPTAIAFTDGPETIGSFIQQRTRWFAGFLQTLWEYRSMIFNPRYGRIGLFILPIKTVDALLPLWGLGSLGILLLTVFSGHIHWSGIALMILGIKLVIDIGLSTLLLSWIRVVFPRRPLLLSTGRMAYCIVTEGLVFHWFRQAAVLNAYSWLIRRVESWDQPRWKRAQPSLPPANISSGLPPPNRPTIPPILD